MTRKAVFLKIFLPIILVFVFAGAGAGIYFGFFAGSSEEIKTIERIIIPDDSNDPDLAPITENDRKIAEMYQLAKIYELRDNTVAVSGYRIVGADKSKFEDPTRIVIPETFRGLPIKQLGIEIRTALLEYSELGEIEEVWVEGLEEFGVGSNIFSFKTLIDLYSSELWYVYRDFLYENLRNGVFGGWSDLVSVELNENISVIGDGCFYDCESLEEVDLSKAADNILIGNLAFVQTPSLSQMAFPKDKESITLSYASFARSGLESVDLGSNVHMTIAEFAECNNLISANLDDGVEFFSSSYRGIPVVVSVGTFQDCTNLESVNLPESLNALDMTFSGCEKLKFDISQYDIIYIGDQAFYECKSITKCILSEDIIYCGERSFEYSGVEEVFVPKTLTSIAYRMFAGCTNLQKVVVAGVSDEWGNNVTNLEEFCDSCFEGCSNLSTIVGSWNGSQAGVFKNVKKVGFDAFCGCVNYAGSAGTLNLPSCERIGAAAFSGCSQIKVFSAPVVAVGKSYSDMYRANTTYAMTGAFSGCSFDSFELGITTLNNVNISSVFSFVTKKLILKNITDFSNFLTYGNLAAALIEEIELGEVQSLVLGSTNQRGMSNLKTFKIGNAQKNVVPSYVTDVNFWHCAKIKEIVFEEGSSVTSLPNYCFERCTELRSVSLPDQLTAIPTRAFYYCQSLQFVGLHDGITSIGSSAFSDCWSLVKIDLPSSLTSIGDYAFGNCHNLAIVVNKSSFGLEKGKSTFGGVARFAEHVLSASDNIDNYYSVDSRGAVAAQNATGEWVLMSWKYDTDDSELTLPERTAKGHLITKYGSRAFRNNDWSTVRSLVVPNSVVSVGDGAFGGCVFADKYEVVGNTGLNLSTGKGLDATWYVEQKGDFETYGGANITLLYYKNNDESYLVGNVSYGSYYLIRADVVNNLAAISLGAEKGATDSIVVMRDAFVDQEIYELIVYDNVKQIESCSFVDCTIGSKYYYVYGTTTTQNITQVANDAFAVTSDEVFVYNYDDGTSSHAGSAKFYYYEDGSGNMVLCRAENCEGTIRIGEFDADKNFVIAQNAFTKQEISQLIVYDNVLRIESRAFVNCYLNSKYYYVYGTTTEQNITQVANDAFVSE